MTQESIQKKLHLNYYDHQSEVSEKKQSVTMGRGFDNDLLVDDVSASRSHVTIKYQADGQFILIDHSSNGTGVKVKNGKIIYVHQKEYQLFDEGKIYLGFSDHSDHVPEPVYYTIK